MIRNHRLLLASLIASAMAGPSSHVEPCGFDAWFEQDPKPVPVKAESVGNPLDYAGARIGLDVRNVELPRAWEGGYRFCCRFPIIDYVSNRPLYMKQWTEDNSARVVGEQRLAGVGTMHYALEVLRGAKENWRGGFESESLGSTARKQLDAAGFTPRYQQALLRLITEFVRAGRWARRGTESLSAADEAFFAASPGYFLAPDGKRMVDLTGNTGSQFDFIQRARRVYHEWIFMAAGILADAVSAYAAATAGFGVADCYFDTAKARTTLELVTPAGTVEVSGFGNDTHSNDAALLIDLGGDDAYTNNAGGCGRKGGVAVCIDHGGDDKYLAPDRSYVQGFGFLGVGMLVDLAGDDVYKAKHFSQGAGILGVGVLWDKAGSDTFSANAFCQGAGMFGLGMMLDDSGDDVYDCATMGQGSATTLGLGILSDLEGNDQYRLACDTTLDALGGLPGYGQGGALSFRAYPWEKKLVAYGGVGMLVDDKGNDTYTSKGWCDQGGSYIMSLGALVDNEGSDHYFCGTGQGSGIHVTNAILIDKKGDDVYEGGFRAGGSGGDRSPGFLIDYEGNDIYKSATSSYGTGCKPFSYSLFIDYKGDDQYICDRPKTDVLFNDWHSFGGVWPESDPNLWPYAISLDLGGNDDYKVRNRANNSETHSFGHGIHLDMEWKGGDVVGDVDKPALGCGHLESSYRDLTTATLYTLNEENPFWKFGTIGRLLTADPDSILAKLIPALMGAHRELARGLMEYLHYLLSAGRLSASAARDLPTLLRARDPEVRLIIADDLGLWKMRGAEDALVQATKTDSNAQVRRFALRSLLRMESVKALPVARKLATEDTCEDVRRMAVTLVGKVRPSGEVLAVLRWVLAEDKASSVRCAAADAMGNLGNPDAVEYLREAAKSPDVYLQRACGKALCQLYRVEGLELLIKSLSFPSIDAFYNYDRNVPNYISTFAGFDVPDSERYVQTKWQAWFDAHRDSINIKANADAFRAYTAMTDSVRGEPDSVQVKQYEAFLVRFPNHNRARAELAGKFNSLAWTMATAAKGTPVYNPALGIKCAQRAVELAPDANNYDTLIEALLAAGRKEDALRTTQDALRKHPNEQMLKDRLRALQKE
jgi:tetratricopeptide (TPR) repeat protein